LSRVLQGFIDEAPFCVMTRGLLENVLAPEKLDRLFERHSHDQARADIARKAWAEHRQVYGARRLTTELHDAGFTWDAARLAGRAATKTSDRAAMVRLLDCARMVQGKPVTARRSSTSDTSAADAVPAGVSLSERELQVAELVVSGLTYRDVGDRLFISAKTVEHHVARMRQRLGATSRSELLSQLRTLVGSSVARD